MADLTNGAASNAAAVASNDGEKPTTMVAAAEATPAAAALATAPAATTSDGAAAAPSTATKSAKAILLKFGIMPDYHHVHQSEEQLGNYLERQQWNNFNLKQQQKQQQQQQQLKKDTGSGSTDTDTSSSSSSILPEPQAGELELLGVLSKEEASEQIVILHSLFSKFCKPPPSVESVINVFLLEQQRVKSCDSSGSHGNGNGEGEGDSKNSNENFGKGASMSEKNIVSNYSTSTSTIPEKGPGPINQNQHHHHHLPKETLIHTSSKSTHFLIQLLKTNPSKCLLKLPLAFQLSLFRILVRLLTEEGDGEYDAECLFDWTWTQVEERDSLRKDEKNKKTNTIDPNSAKDKKGGRERGEDSSDDDDSYDYVRNLSVGSMRERTASRDKRTIHKTKNSNRERTASTYTNNHTNNNTNSAGSSGFGGNKAFEAWSCGRASQKKSGPLYSVIRFRTNPQWKVTEDGSNTNATGTSSSSSSSSSLLNHSDKSLERGRRKRNKKRRSMRWSFVAENVKLDKEEEEALRRESLPDDDDDDISGSDDDESEGATYGQSGEKDVVRILIKIYQAILDRCLTDDGNSNDRSQYLLLGPVAHLIGLVCATNVSVRNLRSLLVLMEKNEDGVGSILSDHHHHPNTQKGKTRKNNSSTHPALVLARLHILRALRYTAEYSSQLNGHSMLMLDRPGPSTFFSFGHDEGRLSGISSTFNVSWPFKYDFGMACWFRAESFYPSFGSKSDGNGNGNGNGNTIGNSGSGSGNGNGNDGGQHAVLFSTRTQSGAVIEVSFETHCVEESPSRGLSASSAATLIVTVIDATNDKHPENGKSLRRVRLAGCVLSPRIWYHVAVRLSRPKLSRFALASFATIKDEVSVFLNGKLMLKEHMKMPQFPDSKNGGGGRGVVSSLTSFAGGQGEPKKMPLEISFFSNFDGQAGSLYVFKEHVSVETIDALYRETTSHSLSDGGNYLSSHSNSQSHFGSFVDHWNSNRSKLYHLTKAVSSASMHTSELGDVVLPNYAIFTGGEQYLNRKRRKKVLYDLAEDEDHVDSYSDHNTHHGLSRAAFGSKLLIVWDPCRIHNGILFDPHSGANVSMKDRGASTWSFESVRDTIESLGGVRRLLPSFGMLQYLTPATNDASVSKGIMRDYPHMLLPSLLFLVASFICDHESNACELFRCGGINVIEKLLHDCKRKDLINNNCSSGDGRSPCYGPGVSLIIAKYTASALLDLWQASRPNFALETTVFSRLLFNLPLLFGGVSKARGIAFHAVMLPVLSEIAMMNPDKVRDCVETGEVFEVVNEYSTEEEKAETTEIDLFSESSLSSESTLTAAERCFVIDTLLGMVVMMLSQRCPTQDLSPLLTFITYNLDLEWEAHSDDNKSHGDRAPPAKHSNRYLSTVKAVSILFFLLQKTNVPNLIDSLADVFENGSCVASWMLCCLVNSFDDAIRGLGIKCLAAYLRRTTSTTSVNIDISNGVLTASSSHDAATAKISKTMKLGLEAISHSANNMLSGVLSGRVNIKVIHKLLWHLLKCHSDRLGDASNAALMYLIVDDGSVGMSSSVPLTDIIVPNNDLLGGFHLNLAELDNRSSKVDHSRQILRNKFGASTVLRLIRFLSNDQKEQWLLELLAFLLASPRSIDIILSCDDWQPVLFQLVAEVLDEIYGDDDSSGASVEDAGAEEPTSNGSENGQTGSSLSGLTSVNTETLSKPSVRTRYDLSVKLYSMLLGHCVRQGDEKAFDAVEMAASLQRVDPNGSEIFSILLSHLFADLIEKGTIASVETSISSSGGGGGDSGRNRALKQSARLVTQAILSNGSSGLDMASAVKQWRCLRHLTALTVAVVTESGFGIVQLFDYRNQDASAVDGITGGMYGIRLDNLVSGVNAFEALAGAKLHSHTSGRHKRDRYRYVSVVLASQVLTLLDAFIFPDNLDTASKAASQLHGLALVRSTEPRLGQSQGTLLASLVRLSLILLAYLEPSSVKFLQACSRLRCFLHWVLEILRESVALGGYSQAFHELTAPLDRIVLAIVLQCHRALSRCSVVLVEMESSPWQKYFSDIELRQKSQRRLFRAILELREIVLAAYRGRNEVLRAALSPEAHDALARGLEEVTTATSTTPKAGDLPSKVASLREFLENDWVSCFHDVEDVGNLVIPEQISQILQSRPATRRGRQAIEEINSESTAIIKEYTALLNAPFTVYCENQRKWAETDAVRDREYDGDVSVKRLSSKFRTDVAEFNKAMVARFSLALQRTISITQHANNPWDGPGHWAFTSYTDLLYRRIVFHLNYNFDNHAEASYELTLGKERESYQREEEARKKRREEAQKKREMAEEALRAAIVPYQESTEEDIVEEDITEDEDIEKSNREGFLGWDVDGVGDALDQPKENEDVDSNKEEGSNDDEEEASLDHTPKGKDNADESEWDQIESSDFDDSNELDPFAWARKFMWAEGEHFVHNFDSVVIVSIQTTREGSLLLTSHSIYFHQTGDTIDVMTKEKFAAPDSKNNGLSSRQDKKWKLNRLTDVHGRRCMLKAQALELFFANMEGLFLTFNGTKERDLFHSKLRGSCKAPLLRSFKSLNPRVVFKKSKLTELWRKRKISNFQYIMALNLMAGRTFNDITQYPVFPWILADYTSETLDLSDDKVYRDLSKPVGALNPDRLEQLIDRYHDLDGFPEEEKFLYGSHYSSPGVVLHYLIRQEPYTSMHIALQSGRFDCPDRLFFDMGGCWRSCNTSTSDVKELLPEFFSCPEIFMNTNEFPLGETQTKLSIDSVKLPPWAKGSPHEFVRLHRLALESDYVSDNLHHWIDLIFGYKQRGPAALSANNVFHYLSYEGSVDIDKVTDDLERKAIEGHIQNFGQTPSQLIAKDPHPARSQREDERTPLFKDLCLENMRCDTPKKQFGGPNESVVGSILSMHALEDTIFAIHSDFTLCSYKLNHSRGAVPFHFKNDKARGLETKCASLSHNIAGNESDLEGCEKDEINDFKTHDDGWRPAGSVSFAIALGAHSRSIGNSNSSSDPFHLLLSRGYFDDCVKIHSFDSLQLLSSQNGGHRGRINCLEVGEEGDMLVTGGDDTTCRIWIVEHDALAAAITDGFVKSSQGTQGAEEAKCFISHILLGHVTSVCCVALCTKLDVVVSGSQDGSICIHKIRSGEFIRSLHIDAITHKVRDSCAGNGIPVRKLAIHMDGSFVAHLCDGSLHAISINGQQLCSVQIDEHLNAMIICTKSETVITGGDMGRARIWKLHDLSLQCTVDVKKHGAITSLALTPSGTQFLCIGCSNGLLSIVSRKE